jgi:hypothetical protein
MATSLAHVYAHQSQPLPQSAAGSVNNEVRAWDRSGDVFQSLVGTAAADAADALGSGFANLTPNSSSRAAVKKELLRQGKLTP